MQKLAQKQNEDPYVIKNPLPSSLILKPFDKIERRVWLHAVLASAESESTQC